MTNNKQSSVRWLVEELEKFELGTSEFFSKTAIINHADRLHKEEIEDAWDKGDYCIDLPDGTWEQKYKSAEQYYNETFGGNDEQ